MAKEIIPIPIQRIQLLAYPELPLVSWFNFIKMTRIKWPAGVMPQSFALPDAPEVEGTSGLYRKPKKERKRTMKAPKKAAPMPKKPMKKGKGKDCK